MLHIESGHIVAKMQCSSTNDEVLKCYRNPFSSLFTLNAASKLRNLQGYWMHNEVVQGTFDEDFPANAVGIGSGSINSVRQFHNVDSRKRNVHLPMFGTNLPEDIFDTFTAPFRRNEDACIQNQAHKISPTLKYHAACAQR